MAAGPRHAADGRFVIYGPAGALRAANKRPAGMGPAGTQLAGAELAGTRTVGAQLAGARTAGMTGAAGLVPASGSCLVRYALPAEPPAIS